MGKFVMKNAKSGGYSFNLLAKNGQAIASSQVYKNAKSCKAGIASIQRNAPRAVIEDQTVEGFPAKKNPKFEVYTDKRGTFRFRLKAGNGQIIANGQGYKTKKSCLAGIASVQKNAVDAVIVDKTTD